MAVSDEMKEKERRVKEFLRSKNLKALLLKRQANFSWMTCGGINLVGITTEMGATSLLITENSKFVISNNIEAPRMIEEESLEEQGFAVKIFPWYEDQEASTVKDLVGGGPVSMAGRKGLPGIGKNSDEGQEGRERVSGRGQALQGIVGGPDRSHHLDVRSR